MGIRKVLGATGKSIVMLMSREFIKLIIISNMIAWPTAYFITSKLLELFAYRTETGILIFIISGAAAMLIALVTVTFQTVKTAKSNPVNSLKCE